MKRGQLTEKETQLVKRVENEFGYFRYKMLSKSRKKYLKDVIRSGSIVIYMNILCMQMALIKSI